MRRSAVATAVILGALVIGACGDGDEESAGTTTAPAETTAAPTGKPVETVSVRETEYKLDPLDAEVSKTGVIELDISNDGSIVHSLEVEGPDGESETDLIDSGDSATLKVDLPRGEYAWYCPIGNHRQLGMDGTITVGGGSGESGGGTDTGAGQSSGGAGGY